MLCEKTKPTWRGLFPVPMFVQIIINLSCFYLSVYNNKFKSDIMAKCLPICTQRIQIIF